MTAQTLNQIRRSMDEQLKRKQYPEGFPPLPRVPAGRYSDPDFAAAEMRHMWKKTWLMAGLESDVPEVGSYVLFERLELSVIVIRGKDGVIRAFNNTCRHRASALLLEPKGRVTRFVCPYHAWSYALDGALNSVPEAHNFACLDKSELGLKSVRCEMWRGLIFINMNPIADSLGDYMSPYLPHTTGFPLENLILKDHFFMAMDCNWKLAYHNFIEGYHNASVHPKSLANYLDSRTFMASLLPNGHSRLVVNKLKGDSFYKADLTASDAIDPVFRAFSCSMATFPNTFFAVDPSGFAFQSFWPVGVSKSILEVRLVGWESSPTDREYWSAIRTTAEAIFSEDMRLFASIQRGVEMGFVPKIVMGYQERALYWLEEEIDRRIGVENIPEDLRVMQVLAEQVGQ